MKCSTYFTAVAIITAGFSSASALAVDDCPHHGPAGDAPAPPAHFHATPGNKFPLPGSSEALSAQRTAAGTLAIRAIQGTPGGQPIANTDVEVQLYHRGMLMETITTQLDEHGIVLLEGLPIAMGLQPVVLIAHADLTYQKVGAVMDRPNPQQSIEVTCYEPSDPGASPPAWRIRMRHVMLAPTPDGVQVTEVMKVVNPDDRTWIGALRDGHERPITTRFPLPDGALGVTLDRGFHDWCCTTLEGNQLSNHLPIMPGGTEMIYHYILPTRRGAATIEIIAPDAPGGVDHLMVLVPKELETTSIAGLESTGGGHMGDMPVRQYAAFNLEPGQRVTLTVSGLSSSGDAVFAAAGIAKTTAAIGVVAVFVGAMWMIFARPKNRDSSLRDASAQRDAETTQNERRPFVGDAI